MLAAITSQLRDALQAQGVPYPVVYGPEPVQQSTASASHIVIERDRQRGDVVRAPLTQRQNPQMPYVRAIGGIARIFGRSTVAGATVADHERVADQLADHLLVALREIVLARKTMLEVFDGRLLTAVDLEQVGLMTWPGVVYELRFSVDRGVRATAWAGEASSGTAAAEAIMGTGVGVAFDVDTTGSPEPTTDLPGASTR